jgi:hypothetical protein
MNWQNILDQSLELFKRTDNDLNQFRELNTNKLRVAFLLDRKHVYQLYLDILPKKKIFAKYIKGKKSDKYENELVAFIAEHFQVSEKDAEEYINIWFELDNGTELESVLKLYGKTDGEIKKLLK